MEGAHPGQGLPKAVMLAPEEVMAGTPLGTGPHRSLLPAFNFPRFS